MVLLLDAQDEGLESAMQQETGVGIERAAEMVEFVGDLSNQLLGTHQHAGHDVGVSVQVLGGAVQSQIESEVEGPKVDRAGEGRVDH